MNKIAPEILTNSSIVMPIAYGAWFFGGSEVFVSYKLQNLIDADEYFIDPYDFVRKMRSSFGDFLNKAIGKVSGNTESVGEYSSITKTKSGDNIKLRLVFDPQKEFFVFFAEKANLEPGIGKDLISDAILNSLPIYIWQRNKNMQLVFCNKKYADALETSQESAISNNIKLIINKHNNKSEPIQYFAKPKNFKEHIVVKGARRAIEITELPFTKDGVSTCFAIDTTDKEDLQIEYDKYRKQMEETLDHIHVPIAIFDAKTNLIFANTAIFKLFGIEESAMFGQKNFSELMDLLHDKRALMDVQDFSLYKKKGLGLFTTIIEPYHTFFYTPSGKTLNLTISPNYGGGLMFLFQDVSDKIALEREINSMAAVQRETISNLKEGIIVFGTDNRIKLINFSALEFWQKKRDRDLLINTHIRNFFEESEYQFISKIDLDEWLTRLIAMASQRVEFSDQITLRSGKTFDYAYVPLPDGLHLIRFLDVTDKANLEKALNEKTEMIAQIDKIKTDLISNISYELRSPLNTIMGFSDILLNEYFGELNSKQKEYCDCIVRSVTKLSEVVDAVIQLASIEAGQMKLKYTEINLFKFIGEIVDVFKNRAKAQNISVKSTFKDKDFLVFIDDSAIRHALFQIVSRSIKMTPASGKIVLSAVIETDYFYLSILDNGIGIQPEDLEQIRRLFINDLDKSSADISLDFGLLLANNIVRLHNGKLSIESNIDKGTEIKICLPIRPFLV